jgi:hypothetical protein
MLVVVALALSAATRSSAAESGSPSTARQKINAVQVNAKWSSFGSYLRRVMESVQAEWERILVEAKISAPPGSFVEIKFMMNSSGAITQISKGDGTAGDVAAHACMNAIAKRSPYGKWTPEMAAALGKEQEMTFKFTYQ